MQMIFYSLLATASSSPISETGDNTENTGNEQSTGEYPEINLYEETHATANVNTATLNCLSTVFKFALNVTELDITNCTESSPVTLNDANWNVKFCKGADATNRTVLDIFVVSTSGENVTKWSSSAQATFKLLQKDGRENGTIEKILQKQKFSSLSSTFGIKEFIHWADLMAQYVKEHKAHFEIEITTDALNCKVPSQMERSYAQLHILVNNVSKVTKAISPVVVVRGIKFNVVFSKDRNHLSVALNANVDDLDINWIYHADVIIKLLPFEGEAIESRHSQDITWAHNSIGTQTWLSWADFVAADRAFVVNDQANFIVEFNLDAPKAAWGIMGTDEIEPAQNTQQNSDSGTAEQQPEFEIALSCTVCLEPFGSGHICSSTCGHLFCRSCFDQTIAQANGRCPTCRTSMRRDVCYPLFF